MERKAIMLAGIFVVSIGMLAQGQGELGVTTDATWVSKYLWRGFDLLDDKAAFQPSINFDLFDTGFSVNVWASYAGAGQGNGSISTVNATEYDYTLAYNCTWFENEKHATDVTTNFIYYDFIDEPDTAADAQELGIGFAWPNICSKGIVPSYYVGKLWPARSNSALTGNYAGWIHILGLGYDMKIPGLIPNTPNQTFHLSAEMVYNDGAGGAAVKHDWSHAVFGVSTGFDLCENCTITPSLWYQWSWEDTVNTEDEVWVGIGGSYKFK